MFHELSAATADKVVLPDVLGPRTLRRTVKYASGPSPCDDPARGASACAARGTAISTVSRQ